MCHRVIHRSHADAIVCNDHLSAPHGGCDPFPARAAATIALPFAKATAKVFASSRRHRSTAGDRPRAPSPRRGKTIRCNSGPTRCAAALEVQHAAIHCRDAQRRLVSVRRRCGFVRRDCQRTGRARESRTIHRTDRRGSAGASSDRHDIRIARCSRQKGDGPSISRPSQECAAGRN